MSRAPFLKAKESLGRMQGLRVAALLPPLAASVFLFGKSAAFIFLASILGSLTSELLGNLSRRQRWKIRESEAIPTGILAGMLMPAAAPFAAAAALSFLAGMLAREIFGGLGQNLFNVPHFSRLLGILFFSGIFVAADPLAKAGIADFGWIADPEALILAHGSKAAWLAGGLFLMNRGVIPWRMPLYFLGTCTVLSAALGRDPLSDLISGGLIAAAFFYLGDYACSPVSQNGRIWFSVFAGAVALGLRVLTDSAYAETFGILAANAAAPMLQHFSEKRRLKEAVA